MGEFAGPAILSRGGGGGITPAAPIAFRPYLNISGIYTSNLPGVLQPNDDKHLKEQAGYGMEAAIGLYGYHAWKRTTVGINYRGDYRRYAPSTINDGSNQFCTFGLTHRPAKKIIMTVREGFGTFTQTYGYMGTFGFYDPAFAQIPRDEMLDTRTTYLTSMADLTYQRTARHSFNFGGSEFRVRRRHSALYGVNGVSARADTAYRVSRFSTIGADYLFTHFSFGRAFGTADVHSVGLDYSIRPSRRWEFGLRAGFMRVETLGLGTVRLDPVVAVILGRYQGVRAFHEVGIKPALKFSASRDFRKSSTWAQVQYGVTPGNGIYLTSAQTAVGTGYSYAGVRYWNFNASANYSRMRSVGQDIGVYTNSGAGLSATRAMGGRNMFWTFRVDARRYRVGGSLQRTYYSGTLGFAYSPGDVPLRLW